MKSYLKFLAVCLIFTACKDKQTDPQTETVKEESSQEQAYFDWDAANVYFMLTDRFNNGDTSNDTIIKRDQSTGTLRGFEGGDFAGVIEKLDEGYFTDLGVNAIWMTPIYEQIHGGVDEGTGYSYGFHGYWAKDWTAVEPSLGTLEEYKTLVKKAHDQGIRVLMDVVLNHTGPVTPMDPQWPDEWVRTGPGCSYQDQATAMTCTLTNNLPDIRTESDQEVELPPNLVEKWKAEGRYEQEVQELDEFFKRSGLKRTPANYVIKWVTDYARETGVDGFRIDTVKHVEEEVWETMIDQAKVAYGDYKEANKDNLLHDDEFFILGELYGFEVSNGREYDFGNTKVDFFDYGYDAMISFGMKRDANMPYKDLFERYDAYRDSLVAENPEDPASFMNYISSHDDGQPFDPERKRAMEAGTKLLLSTGISQIYYGDETARSLVVPEAVGDATLRSNMNWDTMDKDVLEHYQKLGNFRTAHPAVGAGEHQTLTYEGEGTLAARSYNKNGHKDQVLIGAGLKDGEVNIDVSHVFENTETLHNSYTNEIIEVRDGIITTTAMNGIVLLEQ
ncbi:MAG: alpha-amylase family glycosyl hydrolase [Nonlabens sp.]